MNRFKNIIKILVDSFICIEARFYKKVKLIGDKKVLILRKDGLGDCIIFFATLAGYRQAYKDAIITLILPKACRSLTPILVNIGINDFIWFDHKLFSQSFTYRRNFLLDLKRAGYDTAIYPVFTREDIGDLMMKITEAREIIGFRGSSTRKTDAVYTTLVEVPTTIISEIERNKYFIEKILGTKYTINFPTINTALLPRESAQAIIEKNKLNQIKFAFIFPGSGASYKIWPTEKFAEITDYIYSKNIVPVFFGSKSEQSLVQEILDKAKSKNSCIDLSGQTENDLPTLAHIVKKSLFYFGSDTGIAHLSVAVGVPTICLVGSGGIDRFFPYGDLSKNRAIAVKNVECNNWSDLSKFRKGEIHPSIKNIAVADAKKEVDYMLKYTL